MSKAPAVDYALRIIEFFAGQSREIGITDISDALGINKNAVSRILESLSEGGWIFCADTVQKKYALTLRPFSIVSKRVAESGIVRAAEPFIRDLALETGDSVYLGVKKGGNVLYLIHIDSTKVVRVCGCVGGEYPLHCSAPGKTILSWSGEGAIRDYFADGAERRTANTITSADDFLREAEKVRSGGFALDNEEFAKGIICAAAPVFGADGEVIAAAGLSSLTIYDDIASLTAEKLPLVAEAAAKISRALGYTGERVRRDIK